MPYPMNIAAGRNAAAGSMMGLPQGFSFGNAAGGRMRPQGFGIGGGSPPVTPPQFGGATAPPLGGLGNMGGFGQSTPSLPAPQPQLGSMPGGLPAPTGPFTSQFRDAPGWIPGLTQRSPAGPAPVWNPTTGISGGV